MGNATTRIGNGRAKLLSGIDGEGLEMRAFDKVVVDDSDDSDDSDAERADKSHDREELLKSTSQSTAKAKRSSRPAPAAATSAKGKCDSRLRWAIFVGSLVATVLCLIVLLYLLPCTKPPCRQTHPSPSPSPSRAGAPFRFLHWEMTKSNFSTESAIRLIDVNDDGTLDVVTGYASQSANTAFSSLGLDSLEPYRKCVDDVISGGKSTFELCGGGVAAWDGANGTLLWFTPSYSEIFALNCDGVDIDDDGASECVVAGRMGVFFAVNARTGDIFWHGDATLVNSSWNVYTPAAVDDLDGDGVADLVVANGGNQAFSPHETNRDAGQLFVVSGRTGLGINRRRFLMPDGKETYMSPVVLSASGGGGGGGNAIILFGSGGETVVGSLWAIRLGDLACLGATACANSPTSREWVWGRRGEDGLHRTSDGVPLYELIRGRRKGVMVPPVLVDLNGDGSRDIVAMDFEGEIFALDGRTRDVVWKRRLSGSQTHASPAPGLFNNDSVPDLMIQVGVGDWAQSNFTSAVAYVLDGRDGRTLWYLRTRKYIMCSPIVLAGKSDWFLFWTRGRYWSGTEMKNLMGTSSPRARRHDVDKAHETGDLEQKDSADCKANESIFTAELLALSGSHPNPIRIITDVSVDGGNGDPKLCRMFRPVPVGTPSVADVNGDGHPEVVVAKTGVSFTRYNGRYKHTDLRTTFELITLENLSGPFLPNADQPWNAYIGNRADSKYTRKFILDESNGQN